MRLVKPSIQLIWMTPSPLETIELSGRTCYKSEDKITIGSSERFVAMLLKCGHLAMIEHASASYKVVCDRGITHEIVRHRLFSYAQESTRYCNYKSGVTFIIPPWIDVIQGEYKTYWDGGRIQCDIRSSDKPDTTSIWIAQVASSELRYQSLIDRRWSPQQARSVLPNALKTELVITGNLREWMHFFELRTAKAAHPQMQEVANMLLKDIRTLIPVIFDKIGQND